MKAHVEIVGKDQKFHALQFRVVIDDGDRKHYFHTPYKPIADEIAAGVNLIDFHKGVADFEG